MSETNERKGEGGERQREEKGKDKKMEWIAGWVRVSEKKGDVKRRERTTERTEERFVSCLSLSFFFGAAPWALNSLSPLPGASPGTISDHSKNCKTNSKTEEKYIQRIKL